MKLPILEEQYKEKEVCDEFLGYCRKLRISPKQWYSQKNMTTDYYPAASSRAKRSLQSNNSPLTFEAVENEETVSYTASKTLGACWSSGNLYILKSLENSENQVIGCAFLKNGELAFSEEETVETAQFFSNSTDKRSLVRMGSSVCVFPDGVIFETANTATPVPIYAIAQEKSFENEVTCETVVQGDENNYEPITLSSNAYRMEDNAIQKYLTDSAVWVNQPTYVRIYESRANGSFDSFSEGDTVNIKFNASHTTNDDPYASVWYKGGIFDEKTKEANVRILEKGTMTKESSDDTAYIIVSGYVSIFAGRGQGYGSYHISCKLSGVDVKRKMPDIKYACESQNRIWACSKDGHEIYASALGNPYNWYEYSGLSTDSYAVNVGTDGEFTACVNYLGHPLFFKENALHIINGSYPSNGGELDGLSYSVASTTDFSGVEKGSENSLSVINGILYYKSPDGIVAFDGSATSVVSDALGYGKYKNAVSGAVNGKYYVSMQGEEEKNNLFVFDTELKTWCREDDSEILAFLNIKGELLYIDAVSGKIYSVKRGNVLNCGDYEEEKAFEWECETGDIGLEYPNNKYISRIQLRLKLERGESAAIFVMYDSDGVWLNKGEISSNGTKTHLIPIVPVRCDHMRFKIKGRGDAKILSFSKILEEGGDSF